MRRELQMVAGSKEPLSEESPHRASLDAITRGRYKQKVTTHIKALEGSQERPANGFIRR